MWRGPKPPSLACLCGAMAHLPGRPGAPPLLGGQAQPSHSAAAAAAFHVHANELFFPLSLSREGGSGQPVRESDFESFIVYTLASFALMQISCSEKATPQEVKEGSVG